MNLFLEELCQKIERTNPSLYKRRTIPVKHIRGTDKLKVVRNEYLPHAYDLFVVMSDESTKAPF